ncbi:outer membrane protein assembly factor BamA [Falsihalocynthiibacter sp. SS001]|uniref:outer membrane protein assembly factor BamA n=1 Tax=Falsihalocynthiibacter sp. SS001 TaxID=3349698 RepID=UPI0036D27875
MSNFTAGAPGSIATFGRAVRQFLAVFLLILTTALIATPQAAKAQDYRFKSVNIDGNVRVDSATIINYLGIQSGQSLSGGELNAAYQNLIGSGLFESAEITPRGNVLDVRVVEYPTVNRIAIEGNKRLKDDALFTVVRSQPRLVYNPTLAEQDAAALVEAYEVGGRLAATVTPKIIRRSDNRVDLVFEVTEGKVVDVERLRFVGNRAFSDRRLRSVLETKQAGLFRTFVKSDTFVADRIEFDKQSLTDFYTARGFVDFQTVSVASELARERDGVFLTFRIQEGQQFSFGRFAVTSEIPNLNPAPYQRLIKIRSGRSFNPAYIDAAITRMENKALKDGLDFVRVEPRVIRNARERTIDVNFVLVRGPRVFVERIDIEGNTTTLDRVVRQQFRSVEGDPFNPREISHSADRIRALGYFEDVQVETREGSSPDRVIVDVDVEETTTGALTLGLAYSTNDGPGINLGYTQTNLLGRGQTLSFNINTVAEEQSYVFGFTEPFLFGRDLKFDADIGHRTTTNSTQQYKTVRDTFSPSIEFPLSERGRLGLRYRILNTKLSETSPDSSRLVTKDEGERLDNSFGYFYSFDSRRSKIDEDISYVVRFTQNFGFNDTDPFMRATGFMGAQASIFDDLVQVRAIVEGGAVKVYNDGETKITDRFAQNTRIMRGFENFGVGPRDLNAPNQDSLGGNFFAVLRLEADFPIGLPEEYGISGGLFLDTGSYWGLDDTAGGPTGAACPVADCTVDDDFYLRSVIGFALYWDTPLGPLRFNFTKALKKKDYDVEEPFELTISTKF